MELERWEGELGTESRRGLGGCRKQDVTSRSRVTKTGVTEEGDAGTETRLQERAGSRQASWGHGPLC